MPVYLEQELMDKYYNGFSNDVLWPLFHYVPLPMYKAGMEKKFDNGLWEAYKEANKRLVILFSGCFCFFRSLRRVLTGLPDWFEATVIYRIPCEVS